MITGQEKGKWTLGRKRERAEKRSGLKITAAERDYLTVNAVETCELKGLAAFCCWFEFD